jgi:hypothetical protein
LGYRHRIGHRSLGGALRGSFPPSWSNLMEGGFGNIGVEFILLMLLAFGGIALGIIGYAIAMVTTKANPRSRMRRISSLATAMVGYIAGSIVGVISVDKPSLAFVGFFIGGLFGYLLGLYVGARFQENTEGHLL